MLVLSRKKNERIRIGDEIIVEVVEIVGNKVRIGIIAPKAIPVHREEVWVSIHGDGSNSGGKKDEEVHGDDRSGSAHVDGASDGQ